MGFTSCIVVFKATVYLSVKIAGKKYKNLVQDRRDGAKSDGATINRANLPL